MSLFGIKKKRFITRAISEHIHQELQIILWKLIDEQHDDEIELDYLQVFDLESINKKQQITHRQEEPEREQINTISLHSTKPIKTTIWCLDDGENQIMLFPEDY